LSRKRRWIPTETAVLCVTSLNVMHVWTGRVGSGRVERGGKEEKREDPAVVETVSQIDHGG
jgi:hypothetical protein